MHVKFHVYVSAKTQLNSKVLNTMLYFVQEHNWEIGGISEQQQNLVECLR